MQEFTPIEYLQMDIAARHSMDKASWNERLIWFNLHKHDLESFIDSAKEPALYYAGICAYQDYLEGIPSGYAINLDCTSSGVQLLSAMAKDLTGAKSCNVVGNDCKDFYMESYALLKEINPDLNVDREGCKQSIMTAFYGSVETPTRIFGEDNLHIFYEVMERMAPRAWYLNQAFLSLADPEAAYYSYTLPDNFDAYLPVMVKEESTVTFGGLTHTVITEVNKAKDHDLSMGANLTHSVEAYLTRELIRRASGQKSIQHIDVPVIEKDLMVQILWELYKESGMLSVRIFDYLTTFNLRYVDVAVIDKYSKKFASEPFDLMTTHDCYRCLPKYGNQLRYMYRELFEELANSKMAVYLLESVSGKKLNIDLSEDLAGETIGEYLIC